MKFERLSVYKTAYYNEEKKCIEYKYKASIQLSSKDEHTIELNLTEEENKEIIKVVAPILEKAFIDIKDEVKNELA